MRLIDADALKAEWYRLNDINEEDCGARFVGYQEIARLINNAPTVEPTGDLISRADTIEAVRYLIYDRQEKCAKPFKWWFIKQRLNAIPSADAVPIVYCMDCEKSVPLDEHGALWKCKAHDRTTLRHSYCNNGERKGVGDK